MPSAFIDDGYTVKVTISGDGFDEFGVTYRPPTHRERVLYGTEHTAAANAREAALEKGDSSTAEKHADTAVNVVAAFLAEHISGWQFDAEPTADNLTRLTGEAFNALFDAVWETKSDEASKN